MRVNHFFLIWGAFIGMPQVSFAEDWDQQKEPIILQAENGDLVQEAPPSEPTPSSFDAEASLPGLYVKTSQLQGELQRLQGRLEEALHRIDQLEKKIENFQQNAASRFEENFSKPFAGPDSSAGTQPKKQELTITQTTLPTGEGQQEYEKARQLFKEGQPALAREAFEKFIKENPRHQLTPQAFYWTGVTYVVEKNYRRAAEIFSQAYQKYPQSPKKPETLLKLALCLKELGRAEDACITLGQLSHLFPAGKNRTPTAVEQEAVDLRKKWGCKN